MIILSGVLGTGNRDLYGQRQLYVERGRLESCPRYDKRDVVALFRAVEPEHLQKTGAVACEFVGKITISQNLSQSRLTKNSGARAACEKKSGDSKKLP